MGIVMTISTFTVLPLEQGHFDRDKAGPLSLLWNKVEVIPPSHLCPLGNTAAWNMGVIMGWQLK